MITTQEISKEYGAELPEWIRIEEVKDKKYQNLFSFLLDEGEASALALAAETTNVLLLLDDLKARKILKNLNFKFTGALGVVNKAKKMGVIQQIKPFTDKILETNFRISKKVIDELLKFNKE